MIAIGMFRRGEADTAAQLMEISSIIRQSARLAGLCDRASVANPQLK
jgi:hypothetical protein